MIEKNYFKSILAIFILMSVLSCDRFNEKECVIKAIGVGEASIYIELGSKKSECKITVRE
ncbi:hypothetical protein FACS189426_22310 [Bacteroidia bacterium]|nr:hypothetical protein FACS189426_22310 [Bacteroidia bacterium]GHV71027.1 hypothetical protein FACS189420_4530 [Bacteroidia bacterium]